MTTTLKQGRPKRFKRGMRVFSDGLFPKPERQGTVIEPGRDSDLRQWVQWDGASEPMWSDTRFIQAVGYVSWLGPSWHNRDA